MNRLDFMKRLETLLFDITQSEREEALQYYNDYLNDAGVENEEEVLESLGTPEKLASIIRDGLNDGSGGSGVYTENGYKNYAYEEAKQEVIKKDEGKKLSGGMIALIVILCILASPLLAAAASAVVAAGLGIASGILGILAGTAVTGIALLVLALCLIGIGIAGLFSEPLVGICLMGAGILLGGLSVFFIWVTVWICGTAIPWIVKGIIKIFHNLFHKKGGENA